MPNYPEFAALLNGYLAERDRSGAWLASQLGLSSSTVGRWRNDERRPANPEMVVRVAGALGIHGEERQTLLAAAGYAYLETERYSQDTIEPPESFGELLRQYREKSNIPRQELSDLLGGGSSLIRDLEIGRRRVVRDEVKEIIKILYQKSGSLTLVEANELLNKGDMADLRTYEVAEINPEWLNDALNGQRENEIVRSIDFPPEYKQAGISILSYFSEVVSSKYPDLEVGVTIEQVGTTVTLVVTTPEGEKERIEQELQEYSLVIQGKSPPEKYFSSSKEVLALQNKLEIAALEIRQTTRLLETERQHYKARIESLEQQVQWMGSLVDKDRTTNTELIKSLRDLSRQANATTRHSFKTILDILERGIEEEDNREIIEALSNIQREDRSLFQQVSELITIGAIQGVAGNYLYQFLSNLSLRLP